MARVIRLYGKADSFDIEFSRKGEKWEVDIPPDLVDGVYAVQLTAVDELGETAYWVGELFMCSGVCCLRYMRKRRRLDFSCPDSRITYGSRRRLLMCKKDAVTVSFRPSSLKTVFGKHLRLVMCKKGETSVSFEPSPLKMSYGSGLQLVMGGRDGIGVGFKPPHLKITFGKECRHV